MTRKRLVFGMIALGLHASPLVFAEPSQVKGSVSAGYETSNLTTKGAWGGFGLAPSIEGNISVLKSKYQWDLGDDISRRWSLDLGANSSALINDQGVQNFKANLGMNADFEDHTRNYQANKKWTLFEAGIDKNSLKRSIDFVGLTGVEFKNTHPVGGDFKSISIKAVPLSFVNMSQENADGLGAGIKVQGALGNDTCKSIVEIIEKLVYGMKGQQGVGNDLSGEFKLECGGILDPRGEWVFTVAGSVYGEKVNYKITSDQDNWLAGGKVGINLRFGDAH